MPQTNYSGYEDLVPGAATQSTPTPSAYSGYEDLVPKQQGANQDIRGYEDLIPPSGLAQYAETAVKSLGQGILSSVGAPMEAAPYAMQHNMLEHAQKQLGVIDRIDNGEQVPEIEDPIGYGQMDAAQRADFKRNFTEGLQKPLPDMGQNFIVRAGKELQQAVPPVPQGFEGGWTQAVFGAGGSMLGGLSLNAIPFIGPALAGGSFILAGTNEARQRAEKAGATPEQVARAERLGSLAGAMDLVDLALPYVGSVGKALSLIRRIGVSVVEKTGIEAGQEGIQELFQNASEKYGYNPKKDLWENVAFSAAVGGIVGGAVGAVTPGRAPPAAAQTGTTQEAYAATVPTQPQAPAPPVAATTSGGTVRAITLPTPTELKEPEKPATPPEPTKPATPPDPKVIPSNVIDFLAKKAPPLSIPSKESIERETDPNAPLYETVDANPGINVRRLGKLLGPKLYGSPQDLPQVSVKEFLQNSFDAIKDAIGAGKARAGNIDVNVSYSDRTISVKDDGVGMTPEILGNQFLQIAGTHKEGTEASGGLGIAKMLTLFANKNLRVVTLRDGKVAELRTTGAELFDTMETKKKPQIHIRSPSRVDQQMFPSGRGTYVEVTIPESYHDPSTGRTEPIYIPDSLDSHVALLRSPLFHPIDVTFNGDPVPIGNNFPTTEFVPLSKMKFAWGDANVYVTKQSQDVGYDKNLHILSHGVWQFDGVLTKKLGEFGERIPYRFYIDVKSRVKPEDAGYPFDLNRQRFSDATAGDFGKIFRYLSVLYRSQDVVDATQSFGNVSYLSAHPSGFGVQETQQGKLVPKAPPQSTPLQKLRDALTKGETITIKDGTLYLGRTRLPELTAEEMDKFKYDFDQARVPQDSIRADAVMLHDNIFIGRQYLDPNDTIERLDAKVKLQQGQGTPFLKLVRDRFGGATDEFLFKVGDSFRRLRDVVADTMTGDVGHGEYKDMKKQAVGVSMDIEYRGVNIRLPFQGMFVNPFLPQYTKDPVRAAVSTITTMIHEMAHTHIRSEEIAPEMQRIYTELDAHPTFDFHAFKQELVNVYHGHWDVFQHGNGVLEGGLFPIQPLGKRFETSSKQGRDGGGFGDMVRLGEGTESRPAVPSAAPAGPSSTRDESGRAGLSFSNADALPADFGLGENQRALSSAEGGGGESAVQQQPETQGPRAALDRVFQKVSGGTPPTVKAMAAHADRMNLFYKWMYDLVQLSRANPRFEPLLRYTERVRLMHTQEARLMDMAMRIGKRWNGLTDGSKQIPALNAFIDDMVNMRYRKPNEYLNRMPTRAEFEALVKKHGLSDEAIGVYSDIAKSFNVFLDLVSQSAKEEAARRIKDPKRLADRMDAINNRLIDIRSRPFMPLMNFGQYYLKVVNSQGETLHYETFERSGFRTAQQRQQARAAELRGKLGPGEEIKFGYLNKEAEPFFGLPNILLEDIVNKLSLSPAQKAAIEQMQYDRLPGLRFAKKFQMDRTPGYSTDFQRAYAKFFFHGARYYTRTKYQHELDAFIKQAENTPNDNKAGQIAEFMSDHLNKVILDAKGDHGIFKGAIFFWAMGYVPAAAAQNLTQTPMITFPHLAANFGPHSATRALVQNMTRVQNFYKKGYYDKITDFEKKALAYAIQTGRISEANASDLAGVSSGANLLKGIGGKGIEKRWQQFIQGSSFMFEMAEQFNRRVAFRAALDLATRKPNKYTDEAIARHQDEYDYLVNDRKFTPAEARAIITASDVVDQTQYVYARYARPRFMRGNIRGTIFVFKKYLQSTLVWGGQNPKVIPYYLLMSALLGGAAGAPGWDDLRGILQAIGWWKYGKDFDIEKHLRDYVVHLSDGTIDPGLVLHGLSRYGFGIPALLDAMGSLFTGTPGRGFDPKKHSQNIPFPVTDRSRSLTLGNIAMIDPGKIFGPMKDVNSTIADQTQRASGAVFSVAFNMYKAIMDNHLDVTDQKRWERAVPRLMGSASKAFRYWNEGRERASTGLESAPSIVKFDARDTEHMMEILWTAMGYNTLRVQGAWDNIMGQASIARVFDLNRDKLLHEMHEAVAGGKEGDRQTVRQAITDFNQKAREAGFPERQITDDTVRRSVQTKLHTKEVLEQGMPIQKRNIGIKRYIDQIYPEGTIEVRKVK